MGKICVKKARKSDIFLKINAARAYRKGLFAKYRVKLNKKGSPRFCHTWARHGATRSVEWQTKRMMGLLKDQGVSKTNTPSWFHDKQAEMYARECFLRQHKEEMDRIAAEVDSGRSDRRDLVDTIKLVEKIGVGLDASSSQVQFHLDIQHAKFLYTYRDGTWYERSGYPDIEAHGRQ